MSKKMEVMMEGRRILNTIRGRKVVFAALVKLQDAGMGIPESRREVAHIYGLSDFKIKAIENEGITNKWPPLDVLTTHLVLDPAPADLIKAVKEIDQEWQHVKDGTLSLDNEAG